MFIKAGYDLGLALFPKSASSSITNALAPHFSEIDPHTFSQLRMRVAFMREPHERAEAAYRMYRREARPEYNVSSFNRFIDHICRRHSCNSHVLPQTWLATYDGKFLPNWVVRWDFDELSKIVGVKIPHDNRGDPAPTEWGVEERELFDAIYAEDLKLWGTNGKGTRQLDD